MKSIPKSIKPIALVGLAGASATLSFQEVASAYTSPKIYASTLPYKCSAIAQREGHYISSSRCAVSRVESNADFELTDLVRMVEFSNKTGQKSILNQHSRSTKQRISSSSNSRNWIYSVERSSVT